MLYLHLYLSFFLVLLDFYITSCLFVTFMVIYAANAVYAILFLIGIFLLTGFTFVILGVEYLGLVFMIIYVGAIAILFIFILMLLDLRNLTRQRVNALQMAVFTLLTLSLTEYLLYSFQIGPIKFFLSSLSIFIFNGAANTVFLTDSLLVVSSALYNSYSVYVLGCGSILLFVMIGVVLLLAEWAFPFHEKKLQTNKYLIDYRNIVKSSQLRIQ